MVMSLEFEAILYFNTSPFQIHWKHSTSFSHSFIHPFQNSDSGCKTNLTQALWGLKIAKEAKSIDISSKCYYFVEGSWMLLHLHYCEWIRTIHNCFVSSTANWYYYIYDILNCIFNTSICVWFVFTSIFQHKIFNFLFSEWRKSIQKKIVFEVQIRMIFIISLIAAAVAVQSFKVEEHMKLNWQLFRFDI